MGRVAPARGVRIIGGRYRGRRLPVPDHRGLRPTSDRVRETLFNWLAPVLPGARCLDLFAGSGALGLEAASRGAAQVVFLERAKPVARVLAQTLRTLDLPQVHLYTTDACRWLARPGTPFDLLFLDPPFGEDLLPRVLPRLAAGGWLAPRARLYLELPSRCSFPDLPPDWRLIREKRMGQVRFGLVETGGPPNLTEDDDPCAP